MAPRQDKVQKPAQKDTGKTSYRHLFRATSSQEHTEQNCMSQLQTSDTCMRKSRSSFSHGLNRNLSRRKSFRRATDSDNINDKVKLPEMRETRELTQNRGLSARARVFERQLTAKNIDAEVEQSRYASKYAGVYVSNHTFGKGITHDSHNDDGIADDKQEYLVRRRNLRVHKKAQAKTATAILNEIDTFPKLKNIQAWCDSKQKPTTLGDNPVNKKTSKGVTFGAVLAPLTDSSSSLVPENINGETSRCLGSTCNPRTCRGNFVPYLDPRQRAALFEKIADDLFEISSSKAEERLMAKTKELENHRQEANDNWRKKDPTPLSLSRIYTSKTSSCTSREAENESKFGRLVQKVHNAKHISKKLKESRNNPTNMDVSLDRGFKNSLTKSNTATSVEQRIEDGNFHV
eukprot:CAMPEP_0177581158 /NCGR_PEP_ID=MMETSP0419_2-20121207/1986_1 /TAXON_ID=582737 /ORGANISM="Tetraselmis sp., Strain GSL018" /LENGTH=403 /DNA_ID=CAMNT_0019070157 /DNA_START=88 /DNA_END=1299 /DNA_ORIENTATION=+